LFEDAGAVMDETRLFDALLFSMLLIGIAMAYSIFFS
jgi:hypothetical protein